MTWNMQVVVLADVEKLVMTAMIGVKKVRKAMIGVEKY